MSRWWLCVMGMNGKKRWTTPETIEEAEKEMEEASKDGLECRLFKDTDDGFYLYRYRPSFIEQKTQGGVKDV